VGDPTAGRGASSAARVARGGAAGRAAGAPGPARGRGPGPAPPRAPAAAIGGAGGARSSSVTPGSLHRTACSQRRAAGRTRSRGQALKAAKIWWRGGKMAPPCAAHSAARKGSSALSAEAAAAAEGRPGASTPSAWRHEGTVSSEDSCEAPAAGRGSPAGPSCAASWWAPAWWVCTRAAGRRCDASPPTRLLPRALLLSQEAALPRSVSPVTCLPRRAVLQLRPRCLQGRCWAPLPCAAAAPPRHLPRTGAVRLRPPQLALGEAPGCAAFGPQAGLQGPSPEARCSEVAPAGERQQGARGRRLNLEGRLLPNTPAAKAHMTAYLL
jgi:hypothetical protein